MFRKAVSFILAGFFIFSLAGCSTWGKKGDLEAQGLRNQISVLQEQIQAKDEEIISLRDALAKTSEEKQASEKKLSKKRFAQEVKSRPNAKQIQIALANAGYNPGSIDGKMGKQTVDAIKAFQKANNLPADGKVGKQTWNLLKEHLFKKNK